MIVIGLTGSMASGKSETAKLFAAEGVNVFDSDAAVHALYAQGGAAVAAVGRRFPAALREGAVDRMALSEALRKERDGFAALEAIIHPLVRAAQESFIAAARAAGDAAVVLDIPLLFETGRAADMDKIVVTSCGEDERMRRALARPGMTKAKYGAIMARQMPDAEKRARADHVIDTSKGLDSAREQVQAVLKAIKSGAGHA